MKVCFDVDGTLIDYDGYRRQDVINLLQCFKRLNCEVFIWSGGGIDYAKQKARELELNDIKCITKGSIKPDLAIDDQYVNLGIVNFRTNPLKNEE